MPDVDVDVLVGGIPHSLSDGVVCTILDMDGLGIPPLHRLTGRGPQQDGDSDRGYRLDPRIVQMILGIQDDDDHGKRDDLAGWLKPGDSALALRWTWPGGVRVRQLDCHLLEETGMDMSAKSGYWTKIPARFKAGDPTFYDPASVAVVFALGAGGGSFVVPVVIPLAVGASTIDASIAIAYAGSYLTYPVITIDGPIQNCVITNLATGEKLDFTGVTIAVGEQRVIDLRYGSKTVVSEAGANKIADLTSDSNLATWHIATDPEAIGGVNSIQVEGTGCAETTKVTISFYTRYISL